MGMVAAPIPNDEPARLEALRALDVLDTPPDAELDELVKLASELCGVPIALVSLIDEHRQWFKSKVGLDASETPRDVSYCGHAIVGDETLVVPNAGLDPRFADNPLRTGEPRVEFYAGVPLRTSTGHNIGTLCVIDHVPRSLTPAQKVSLEALAAQVVRLLELRRATRVQRDMLASMQASDRALRRGHASGAPPAASQWSRGAFLLAGALGLASLLASLWVWSTVEQASTHRLEHAGERVVAFFEERTRAYAEILRGTAALFHASDHVTRREMEAYLLHLGLESHYPGLLGLGHAQRVPRAELGAWLERARQEVPELRLATRGDAPELVINRLIVPVANNSAAIGLDIASEPTRAKALAESRRHGDIAVTRRVVLRQDPTRGPGFIMYLPLVESRGGGSEVTGWVFAALRGRDLTAGMEQAAGRDVELRVIDQPEQPPLVGAAEPSDDTPRVFDLAIADRVFRLEVRAGKGFLTLSERSEPWAILVLGLFATGLTFALATSMRRTQERSHALAMRMTDALRRGEQELRNVIDGTSDFVLTFAADGRLTLTNRALRRTLGYDDVAAMQITVAELIHADARGAFLRSLEATPAGETRFVETVFRTRQGVAIDVEGALSFVEEGDDRLTQAIFRDVSARRKAERALTAANEALLQLATTDGLTGIANRRVFDERIAEEVSRARRAKTPLSLALIDVDFFKLYNDSYGHQQGDDCLRKVASTLQRTARRAGELAARYGGEELALILPGSDARAAAIIAEHARAMIEALAIAHGKSTHGVVTVSIGVATLATLASTAPDDVKTLIGSADGAVYRAKAAGRNRVEVA